MSAAAVDDETRIDPPPSALVPWTMAGPYGQALAGALAILSGIEMP